VPDVPTCRAGFAVQISQLIQAGLVKSADLTGVRKEEIQIPVRDGAQIRALLYRPEKGAAGPLIVYFHGGGWCIGTPEMSEHVAASSCKQLGATFLSVDYRKAPEYVFPTAPHDAWDTTKWVSITYYMLGIVDDNAAL
jgi:acetyl esterase/lipase